MKRTLLFIFALCASIGLSAQMVSITMNVDMNQHTVSPDGVSLAGGSGFGLPGDNPMTDPDGDGVYSITVMRPMGFESHYTFVNGPSWADKENIAGQSCADPANFNDRLLPAVTGDVVINTCFGECTTDFSCSVPPTDAMVTFQVNMQEEATDAAGVFLAGNFNGWSGTDNPMEDPDGDDIWTLTAPMPQGLLEFKFVNGSAYETMDAVEDAACTMDFGGFVNRTLDITSDAAIVLDPFCYQACDDCDGVVPDMVSVTFNVNMTQETVSADGLSLAGGSAFGVPGDNLMQDPDGDGIYTITFMLAVGTTSNYTYVNGPGWGDKENIGGLPCSDPSSFDDRLPITLNQDTVINTCFGQCTDDTNCVTVDMAAITFNVNMSQYTVAPEGVSLAGGNTFGGPGDNPMTDPDGDGIYSVTLMRPIGITSNYTFVNGPGWGDKENIAGLPCSDPSNFDDRLPITINQDTVINTCFGECTDDTNCTPVGSDAMVTFQVDMSEYTGTFTTVELNGTFNNWCGDCTPMADDDMDGIWEVTVELSPGYYEYKFSHDYWMGEENLTLANTSCTVTNGTFTNRPLDVTADATLDAVCWESCNACGFVPDMVSVTFNVNMTQETVSADGLSLAGGSAFGVPGDNLMEDPDGDGIYSITLMREAGTVSNYTYVNGPAWGDKENIAGLPCSDPNNFDDRLAITLNQDTVINTCFGQCTDDTDCITVDMAAVTFNVNMSEYTVAPEGVSLAGGSAFGFPGDNPMEDPDGDGIYTITMMVPVGITTNYTFINGSSWDDKENIAGLPCSDPNNFDDRLPITINQDTVINTCFAECTDDTNCTPVNFASITFNVNMSEYTVAPEGVSLAGGSAFGTPGTNLMEDPDGDGIYSITLAVAIGVTTHYTFVNGPEWSDKENIVGLPCSDPNNFDDRMAITISQDTTISTCFGECTDDTNCTPLNLASVTFNLNMSEYTVAPEGVSVAGGSSFNGPGDNLMEDPDGDGIYSITLMRPIGITSHYTFVNGATWDDKEDIAGLPCSDPNNFDDRLPITITGDIVISTCFQECTDDTNCTPVGTKDILSENTIFRLAPSLTNGTPVMLYFNESSKKQRTVTITNTIGQVVYASTVNANALQHAIETGDFANGLYYVIVESDQQAAIEKFIVSK